MVGGTLDDALGEAYDKAARQLGLPLGGGGGPAVEALARKGDGSKRPLPVPMLGKPGYDFSFSGLKNAFKLAHAAVRLERGLSLAPSAPQSPSQGDATGLFSEEDKKEMEEHHIRGYRLDGAAGAEREVPLPEQDKADLAASFQNAAIAHLEDRVGRAMVACDEEEEEGFGRTLVVVGGVAANQEVGRRLRELCARGGRRLPKSAKDREALANVRAWTLEVYNIEHLSVAQHCTCTLARSLTRLLARALECSFSLSLSPFSLFLFSLFLSSLSLLSLSLSILALFLLSPSLFSLPLASLFLLFLSLSSLSISLLYLSSLSISLFPLSLVFLLSHVPQYIWAV